jgi:hypothetical protein
MDEGTQSMPNVQDKDNKKADIKRLDCLEYN